MSRPTSGGSLPVILIREATAASILTASYVELDAVLSHDVAGITVFNGLDQDIRFAIGAAGSEADILYVPQGTATAPVVFNHALQLSKGQRLSVRALAADATSGRLNIILWG